MFGSYKTIYYDLYICCNSIPQLVKSIFRFSEWKSVTFSHNISMSDILSQSLSKDINIYFNARRIRFEVFSTVLVKRKMFRSLWQVVADGSRLSNSFIFSNKKSKK